VTFIAFLTWAIALLPGFWGPQLSYGEAAALVARYDDWPQARMLAIFDCESRLHVGAVSPSLDVGISQINIVWWGIFDPVRLLRDAAYAVEVAHTIWLTQGEQAWVCAKEVR